MPLRIVLGLAIGALASPALADKLSGEDIRSEIVGRRIFLAAPFGGEFPLNYRRNGVVDGNGEAIGLGRWAKPSDQGKWWVRGDRLCQQFQSWYKGAPMCFDLTRVGSNRVRWVRENGETGVARIGGPLESASR